MGGEWNVELNLLRINGNSQGAMGTAAGSCNFSLAHLQVEPQTVDASTPLLECSYLAQKHLKK